ncbi:retron St85 family RNA-directed DNA polymerase [Tardiphaga sp.]|uniref:retron St85 family RNA-directed DNA polymerase n=1 Tax=Tardiphaga sp. TaxID=1926292 RepID=UPI00352BBB15
MSDLIPLLIAQTGLSESDILGIIRNAPRRYKTYAIEKRNGGERVISQPARELKALQRILMAELLAKLPVHVAATAYREGISIKANALAHAQNGPIMKFDFENFFPSITARDWRTYCERRSLFRSEVDLWLTTNVFFKKDYARSSLVLAIGAPSSPLLSNILMHEFDEKVAEIVRKDQVTYTRYADDLTFSAKRTGFLTKVESNLRKIIRELKSPSLSINEAKTVLATTKYKRFVTGLVLTNDGAVSIGHDRKRIVRAAVHRALTGKLSSGEKRELAGFLAFIHDVEPDFLVRIENKYGAGIIRRLQEQ